MHSFIRRQEKSLPVRSTDPYIIYSEAVKALSGIPPDIPTAVGILQRILEPLAGSKGELAGNGQNAYFARDGVPFTNFAIALLAVIEVHFPTWTKYEMELLIWGKNLPPKTIRLEARELGSRQWLDNLGPKYICEKGGVENLRFLIQTMSQYAPTNEEYGYSGWDMLGKGVYIMDGQQLCGCNWDAEKARTFGIHALTMLDVAPHSLTIPLLAVALLSLVHSRMMAFGIFFKGVCCIVAPTQSFKTTVASLFFDFENGREADTNFEATAAAIIRTVGNVRDSTVIVDDFKPGTTKAESNEMVRKLSTIIRMCSDDSGGVQKAGTQNSTLSNVAHGLVVVTAEQVQLQVQSTLARLLIFEMNRKSVNVEKLTYFQDHHQAYRDFIQDFVRYIASQNVNQFCERLTQRFLQERNTLRKEIPADVPVDNRTSDMCTWLWIAFGEFLNYAQAVAAISTEQFNAYSKESRTVFLAAMEQQAGRVSDLNPIKQFFRGLGTLLDTKEAILGELEARNAGYSASDSREAIGFIKHGSVYLKNGVAIQAVASYFRRYGTEFTISESMLRKALADNGYILPKGKGYIHRLSVNHKSYQCMKFEQSQFDALRKGGKQDETGFDEELPSDRAVRRNADSVLGK